MRILTTKYVVHDVLAPSRTRRLYTCLSLCAPRTHTVLREVEPSLLPPLTSRFASSASNMFPPLRTLPSLRRGHIYCATSECMWHLRRQSPVPVRLPRRRHFTDAAPGARLETERRERAGEEGLRERQRERERHRESTLWATSTLRFGCELNACGAYSSSYSVVGSSSQRRPRPASAAGSLPSPLAVPPPPSLLWACTAAAERKDGREKKTGDDSATCGVSMASAPVRAAARIQTPRGKYKAAPSVNTGKLESTSKYESNCESQVETPGASDFGTRFRNKRRGKPQIPIKIVEVQCSRCARTVT
jgi:hypothetical protein